MQSQATADRAVAAATQMRRRRRRIDLYPYLLVAPAMLFILIVTVYPSLYAIRLSLFDANLLRFAASQFVGLDNYVAAFRDEIFLDSILRTVRWIVVIAASLLVVALPVALLLNRNFHGRAVVRTAVLIPWVIPGAVVAIIWRYLTDSNHGIIGDLLVRAGVLEAPAPWISQPLGAFFIIVVAMVWTGFPFFAITLLAALQVIPTDLYESAKVDGATGWQSFRFITFPMLLPTILMLLLIRSIWLSHAVDLPFMMTNGGPGYSNYTIAVYSFLLTHSQLEIGYPAAIAVMLAIVLLAGAAVYIRLIERYARMDVTMLNRSVRIRTRGLLGVWIFSALVLFIALAPFVWIVIVSLTPELSQFTQGIRYFPSDPTLENYFNIFTVINFGQGMRNSIWIAVIVTVLSIVISISAAYAFARYTFPGRTVLILFLLVVYMIPGIVLLMPMMVIFRTLGLMNTFAALILAEATHSVPFAIWLLMNYFASLPRDLEDAGLVDGCTRLGALVRIVLPLAVPGVLAAALFVFIGSWNNFLFAFMLTSGERVRTLPVLLRIFVAGDSGVYWGTVMAGAVLTTLPVALLFLFFQRYLISGLAAGAVKG